MLPLQRYAKKQKEAINEIKNCIETKRQELVRFDDKIKRASEQNRGHLSACGNCHLKLGHTRKICTFSPCKSSFSCGILSKHSSEKLERSNLGTCQKLAGGRGLETEGGSQLFETAEKGGVSR